MTNKVTDVPPTTSYIQAQNTPRSSQVRDTPRRIESSLHRIARQWYAFRWQLARTVFSRPIPFVTSKFDFKLGDFLVTIPVSIGLLAYAAIGAQQQDVEGSSGAPTIALIAVFGFAIRNNSPLLSLTGLPFERALLYHKWFAWIAVLTGALHGLAFYLQDQSYKQLRQLKESGGKKYKAPKVDRAISGLILLSFMIALVVFSLPPIRRRYFEVFVRFHWILFVGVIVFAIIHGAGAIVIGAIPWLIDVLFRYVYRMRGYTAENGVLGPEQVTFTKVRKDLVRVQFPRVNGSAQFKYEVGQYAFLCIPHISKLEWHPFTIASTPYDPMVTFYIKALGDWTKKLAKQLPDDHNVETTWKTLVDGPYGEPSIEWDNSQLYQHFVLFAGGVGATPMMSFANHLFAQTAKDQGPRPLNKVWFVWSVREREMIETLMVRDTEGKAEHNWMPNGLHPFASPMVNDNTFICDIFLTKSERDPNHIVDQQLASHLYYKQRPNITETLRVVGLEAQQQRGTLHGAEHDRTPRVAVLVCGPAPLVADVEKQSQRLTRELRVQFDVHKETFLF